MTSGLDDLRRLAAAGPGSIRIVVNPPRREVDGLLSRASLLWHACGIGSDDPANHEHFGIVVAEAMAAGAAAVAAGLGGIPEIVEDGVSGFLVADAEGFAERTERLLVTPSLCHRMASAARIRAGRFSEARYATGLQGLARELLATPRTRRDTGPSPPPLEVARVIARIPAWRGAWQDERLRRGRVQRLMHRPFLFTAVSAPREPVRVFVQADSVPGRARLHLVTGGRRRGSRVWGPGPATLSWILPPAPGGSTDGSPPAGARLPENPPVAPG
jgi:hypothetical protein